MDYHLEHGSAMVHSRWLTPVDSQMYREGMLHVYETIKEQHIKNWLYDASKYTVPDLAEQVWTVEVLGGLLAGTSLRKIAVVLPKDILLQVIADKVRSKSKPVFQGSIRMENFLSLKSAREWLLNEG